MVSAWYAVVFLVGVFLGTFARVGEVKKLRKKIEIFENARTGILRIPQHWIDEDIAAAKEDEGSISTQAKNA